jgi:hypothetical protein
MHDDVDERAHARAGGVLYLVTFASSIPAALLLAPVLDDPDFVLGAGSSTRVLVACLLDLVNALACIGTAVALYPVVRRRSATSAIGFVATRSFEAAVIVVGIVCLLAVVTLRGQAATGDDAALVMVARALVAVRDWTFLLGPGVMPACNALFLGAALYRSHAVPRLVPVLGLIGAPMLLASSMLTWFHDGRPITVVAAIAVLPIFLWELSLGVWLTARGVSRARHANAGRR